MTRARPGEPPITGDIGTSAPDRVKELIYAAFDIHALYRKDQHQLTIRAVLALSALSTPAAPPPAPTHSQS
jgi:hypothetical protein